MLLLSRLCIFIQTRSSRGHEVPSKKARGCETFSFLIAHSHHTYRWFESSEHHDKNSNFASISPVVEGLTIMPLIESASPSAFKSNVRELVEHGTRKRPMKQILAIAYAKKREAQGKK